MARKPDIESRSLKGNPAYVLLGELGRAHGLKGEIRLKSFTADPLSISDYNPLTTDEGNSIVITGLRRAAGDQPDLLVAQLEGVASRDEAEALNRKELYVERSRLHEPEEEDEFLHADLIGLKAVDPEGEERGSIAAISNYGGGDILEIEPGGLLVPFTKEFVPAIDIRQGFVVVDYAESGQEEIDDGES